MRKVKITASCIVEVSDENAEFLLNKDNEEETMDQLIDASTQGPVSGVGKTFTLETRDLGNA